MKRNNTIVCGTFTKLKLNEPQPLFKLLPSSETVFLDNELSWRRSFKSRLRAKLRSQYCLDASCILPISEATFRVFGVVYSPIGREMIDIEVQIDNVESKKPLSINVKQVFPLPSRLQSSGLLKMQAFENAMEETIIVFADRSGASMFSPYRSNFNEGCIWVTRYDKTRQELEVLSLTSRFFGRKPKEILFHENRLYLQVNDDDWISWSVHKEIDPIAEKHMRYIFTDLFGVSAQDSHGWLAPHSSGELDKELFDKLTTIHKPLFSNSLPLDNEPEPDTNDSFELDEFLDFDDFLPTWLTEDLQQYAI